MTACTGASCVGSLPVIDDSEAIKDGRLPQERGCGAGQGYPIAHPMLAAEVPVWPKRYQGPRRHLQTGAGSPFKANPALCPS